MRRYLFVRYLLVPVVLCVLIIQILKLAQENVAKRECGEVAMGDDGMIKITQQ
jgi:hypothetical protein